ncbi:hypothetical protein XCR1_960030 [Xenorhabdus cabanillasii JM26]|uniref:Uncharacterized protein n=1 Tax=Xenorhabdus cabanillasii JM26 TaxID=1427517 RepID=W1JCV4_9GAMM|nr:hypothetical protein XCR1_960030 [Xenorhabdus cabanillasii JM26]
MFVNMMFIKATVVNVVIINNMVVNNAVMHKCSCEYYANHDFGKNRLFVIFLSEYANNFNMKVIFFKMNGVKSVLIDLKSLWKCL